MLIYKHELTAILGAVKNIVQKNDVFPALSGVLVNQGLITATNTEVTLQVKSEASEGERFIIPMAAFEFIQNLPNGMIEITESGKEILIKIDRIKNKFATFPNESFTYDKRDDADVALEVPGELVEKILGSVLFAVGDKQDKPVLTGIHIVAKDGHITATASDGHIIAQNMEPAEVTNDIDIVIPKMAAQKICDIGMNGTTSISVMNTMGMFENGEHRIYTRLIAGKYPDLTRIISTPPDQEFLVDRKAMLSCMQRVKCCVDEGKPAIFSFDKGTVDVSTSGTKAEFRELLELNNVAKEPGKIALSHKLVSNALKAFSEDEVIFGMKTKMFPISLKQEGSNLITMIMPTASFS